MKAVSVYKQQSDYRTERLKLSLLLLFFVLMKEQCGHRLWHIESAQNVQFYARTSALSV